MVENPEQPERFFLEHLDQVDVVGPDGKLIKLSELMPPERDAEPKLSKDAVDYGPGTRREHCAICRHFQPPHACERVEGTIDPTAWCEEFEH